MKKILIMILCGSLLHYPQPHLREEQQPAETYAEVSDIDSDVPETAGIDVEYHSVEEIRAYARENAAAFLRAVYDEKPDYENPPYAPGKVNEEVLNDALKALNTIRYIAGLSHDVTLDPEYTEAAQAGSLLNAVTGILAHGVEQPEGMSDELYKLGMKGIRSSNLASGRYKLADAVINAWLTDSDNTNIDRLGHRRWLLNAKMGKTGFGQVGKYTSLYAFDSSGSIDRTSNVWPAQNTPLEFFSRSCAWSVSTGEEEDIEAVTVHMTDTKAGKTYTFSQDSADGYFNVDNRGYGVPGAVIWRPDSFTLSDGDTYEVFIEGLCAGTIRYTVHFFRLNEEDTMTVSPETITLNIGESAYIHTEFPAYSDDSIRRAECDFSGDPYFECSETQTNQYKVTALSPGTKDITFITFKGLRSVSRVTVKTVYDSGISISPSSLNLTVGDTVQLKVSADVPEAANRKIRWNTSSKDTAEIDSSGNVYGRSAGTAEVTAVTEDGLYSDFCSVHVQFKDVTDSSKYYYDPVYWAADQRITNGTTLSTFSPYDFCTREQFVTFMWRLNGGPRPQTDAGFTDVAQGRWYYEPVCWAYENGITTGLNDGTGRFGVGQACTREQCVTFLARSAGISGGGTNPFTDVKHGAYYYDAVTWAAESGITTGLNDGTGRFGVGQKCTRAMLVTFLYRFAHCEKNGLN